MSHISICGLVAVCIEGRYSSCGFPRSYVRCETTWIDLTTSGSPPDWDQEDPFDYDAKNTEWVENARHWKAIAACLAELAGSTLDEFERARDRAIHVANILDDRSWEDEQGQWEAAIGELEDWMAELGRPATEREALTMWQQVVAPFMAKRATRQAKKRLTSTRRGQFNSARPELALALIERGDPHMCSESNCYCTDDMTVDHVVPLSRGGTDDLSNLRFLCRSCNSRKKDHLAVSA